MNAMITLPTDPSNIPGVESVAAEEGKLVVRFKNGTHATVQRSPLSRFIHREAFDVYLPPPPDAGLIAAEIAPTKSAEEVLALLGKMAAEAAGN